MEHAEPQFRKLHAGRTYDFSPLEPLVLDPSSYFRGLMIAMLRQFGFVKIAHAETPADAFDVLRAHKVDLLFTELAFPDEGFEAGLNFVQQLRRSSEAENPMLPIVAVTGYAEREQVLAARDAGITEFLAKPLSPDTLFHRTAMVVDEPRSFVRAPNYVGPDRRRFVHYEYDGPERRGDGSEAEILDPDPAGRLARARRDEADWSDGAEAATGAGAQEHG